MSDLLFQRSDEQAIEQIMLIENRAYPYPWSRQQFIDCLKAGYSLITVTEGSKELVGYFVIQYILDELHILNVCVRQEKQGQGLGTLLIEQIVSLAQEALCSRLLLEVRRSNKAARSLYQKQGFETIGIRQGYYPAGDNNREDAIVMEYLLG